jgi:hypothetical protein
VSGGVPPWFFVSVAFKEVKFAVSLLDATLGGSFVSVASKEVVGEIARLSTTLEGRSGRGKQRERRFAEKSGRECGLAYTRKNSTPVWIG